MWSYSFKGSVTRGCLNRELSWMFLEPPECLTDLGKAATDGWRMTRRPNFSTRLTRAVFFYADAGNHPRLVHIDTAALRKAPKDDDQIRPDDGAGLTMR